MWTKVTQQSQRIKTELALPSPGRKETKAGLGVEGPLWWGPWQSLGARPPPGAQKPSPQQVGGRTGGRRHLSA